jgi:hypothetical protein
MIRVEEVVVEYRERPKMARDPRQGRTRWKDFNQPTRIYLRSRLYHLTTDNASHFIRLFRDKVLKELGIPNSNATLKFNATGGVYQDAVLELNVPMSEGYPPRAEVYVFVEGKL